MKFRGNPGPAQGEIKQNAVFRRHDCVFVGVEEENRGSLGGHLQFGGQMLGQSRIGVIAKQIILRALVNVFGGQGDDQINQYGEAGPGTEPVDRIGSRGLASIEQGGGARSEMASGGEAYDSDTVGLDALLIGAAALSSALGDERGRHEKGGKQDVSRSHGAAIVPRPGRPTAPVAPRPYNE
jgi:hypothetical protein